MGRCREGSEGYRRPDDQDQHPPRPPPEEHSSEKTRDNCGPPVHLGSEARLIEVQLQHLAEQ